LTTQLAKNDFRSSVPRFAPEVREANLALINLIKEVASRKSATPAQIALGWLLAQKPWIVPIPGTLKLNRLEENLGGADIEFSPKELADFSTAASNLKLVGDRTPKEWLDATGR
jgi:aryl-alcohol dehydrogenase-like predicted oxidoreductase